MFDWIFDFGPLTLLRIRSYIFNGQCDTVRFDFLITMAIYIVTLCICVCTFYCSTMELIYIYVNNVRNIRTYKYTLLGVPMVPATGTNNPKWSSMTPPSPNEFCYQDHGVAAGR